MLTRRSRKEAVASPDESSNSIPKTKKSSTPVRRKSKSVDRKIRTRSRSSKRLVVPHIVLKRFDDPVVVTPKSEKSSPHYFSAKLSIFNLINLYFIIFYQKIRKNLLIPR